MPLLNLFKSKKTKEREKREAFLLSEFEAGRIIHVDDNIDNKEVFTVKPILEEPVLEEESLEETKLEELPFIEPKIEDNLKDIEKEWVHKAIQANLNENEITKKLLNSGYSLERIKSFVDYHRTKLKK